jgi:predicted ArsR family transcriptional regulator
MADPVLERDIKKLLALLREAPHTNGELAVALRLSATRVRSLLLNLQKSGKVHAPHCITNTRGRTVNLWELRHPESSSVPGD